MTDSNEIIKNPYSRRKFYAFSFVTIVALFCIRYAVLPAIAPQGVETGHPYYTAISSILDHFLIALISSLITTVVLLWFSPTLKEMAEISVVKAGKELKTILAEDVKDCGEFWYRGHTAKWTRTYTVKELAKQANEERLNRNLYIIILNPSNDEACELLAEYDHRRNPTLKIPERLKFIKRELIATILTLYIWKGRSPYLKIHVALNDKFSLFRIDLYSKAAFVTRSSPNDSAIRYSSKSDFYKTYKQEMSISWSQAKQLSDVDRIGIDFDNITVQAARELLTKLGIGNNVINDEDLEKAIIEVKEGKPPYQ